MLTPLCWLFNIKSIFEFNSSPLFLIPRLLLSYSRQWLLLLGARFLISFKSIVEKYPLHTISRTIWNFHSFPLHKKLLFAWIYVTVMWTIFEILLQSILNFVEWISLILLECCNLVIKCCRSSLGEEVIQERSYALIPTSEWSILKRLRPPMCLVTQQEMEELKSKIGTPFEQVVVKIF